MRIVFDTNIFLRAVLNPHGLSAWVLHQMELLEVIVSKEIVDEIVDVFSRPELRRKYPDLAELDIERALTIVSKAEVVLPTHRVNVCRDPNDDKFLECALEGKAEYLVTEDKDLLSLKAFGITRIVNTSTFAKILRDH